MHCFNFHPNKNVPTSWINFQVSIIHFQVPPSFLNFKDIHVIFFDSILFVHFSVAIKKCHQVQGGFSMGGHVCNHCHCHMVFKSVLFPFIITHICRPRLYNFLLIWGSSQSIIFLRIYTINGKHDSDSLHY